MSGQIDSDTEPAARLSCADSAFPRLSHPAALAVIEDLGIGAVDVCIFEGYEHNPPATVLPDPRRAAERVGAALAERGFAVADVFAILGDSFEALAPNHPDPGVREESRRQFEALVEFAAALESPGLTILPGAPFDDGDALARAATELAERARIAAQAGLRLAVEPHYGSVIPTPGTTLEFLDRAEGVGIALDLSHFAFQGIPDEASNPLLSRTHHVHVRQASEGVMQARVGEGAIDFCALRDRLLANGYDGYFALEYQWEEGWLDFTHVDCIAETIDMRDLLLGRAA